MNERDQLIRKITSRGRHSIGSLWPFSVEELRAIDAAHASAAAPRPVTSGAPPRTSPRTAESPHLEAITAEIVAFKERHGRMPTKDEAFEIAMAEHTAPGAAARERAALAARMGLAPPTSTRPYLVGNEQVFPTRSRR